MSDYIGAVYIQKVSEKMSEFTNKWLKVVKCITLFAICANVTVLTIYFDKLFISSGANGFTAETLLERGAVFFSVIAFMVSTTCIYLDMRYRGLVSYNIERLNESKQSLQCFADFGDSIVRETVFLLFFSIVSLALVLWVPGLADDNDMMKFFGMLVMASAIFVSLFLTLKDKQQIVRIFNDANDAYDEA